MTISEGFEHQKTVFGKYELPKWMKTMINYREKIDKNTVLPTKVSVHLGMCGVSEERIRLESKIFSRNRYKVGSRGWGGGRGGVGGKTPS